MRKYLFLFVALVAVLTLFAGVVAGNATADGGKGKTEPPKATEQEPTKAPETPEPTKEPPGPKDFDKDGVPDDGDNCPETENPDQANADGDKYGDACDKDDDNDGLPDEKEGEDGTDPKQPDSDKDSCDDGAELGADEEFGGRRDPTNPWDFYDTNGDASVDLFEDIFTVAMAFGSEGDPQYDVKVDRSPPPDSSKEPNPDKREPWDMGKPDGTVDLFTDVIGAASQFGHTCEDDTK